MTPVEVAIIPTVDSAPLDAFEGQLASLGVPAAEGAAGVDGAFAEMAGAASAAAGGVDGAFAEMAGAASAAAGEMAASQKAAAAATTLSWSESFAAVSSEAQAAAATAFGEGNGLSGAFGAAQTSISKSLSSGMLGVGGQAFGEFANMGKVAFLGIAGGAAIGGAAALKMGGDFQQSMTQLVTGAGESQSNIKQVSDGILSMAGQTATSASDLASGMYMVESAGFRGSKGLDVLRASAEGAKVGAGDMATVANAVTSAMNDYGPSAGSAASVTNDLIAAVGAGKMHLEDLAGALGTVGPAASAVGVPLADVTGAIATMTAKGIPAADAATYLKQTMLQLANPSGTAQKAMADVGLSSDALYNTMHTRGLPAALDEMQNAIASKFKPGSAEYVAHMAAMVGGSRSMQAALTLTGSGMDTFKGNVAAVNGAVRDGGSNVRGWKDVQQDFNFQVGQAVESVKSYATQIGLKLIPYVEAAGRKVGDLVGWFQKHQTVAKTVAVAVGTVLVVAIAAYTISMGAAAIATIAALWPILLIVAAAAALGAGIYLLVTHWKEVSAALGGTKGPLGAIQQLFGNLGSLLKSTFQPVLQQIIGLWKGTLVPAFQQILPVLKPIGMLIGGVLVVAFGLLVGVIKGVVLALVGVIKGVVTVIGGIVIVVTGVFQVIGGIVQFFIDLFTGHFDKLGKDLGTIWLGITNILLGAVRIIEGVFQGLWGAVSGFLSGFISGVVGFFQGLFDKLVGHSIIPDMVNGIVGWFAGLPGKALGAVAGLVTGMTGVFTGLASSALKWGSDLIGGLISGITGAAGHLKDAVSGVLNGVGNLFHGSFPAKEGPWATAHTWMPDLFGGLAASATGSSGVLHTAMAGALVVPGYGGAGALAMAGAGAAALPGGQRGGGNVYIIFQAGSIQGAGSQATADAMAAAAKRKFDEVVGMHR